MSASLISSSMGSPACFGSANTSSRSSCAFDTGCNCCWLSGFLSKFCFCSGIGFSYHLRPYALQGAFVLRRVLTRILGLLRFGFLDLRLGHVMQISVRRRNYNRPVLVIILNDNFVHGYFRFRARYFAVVDPSCSSRAVHARITHPLVTETCAGLDLLAH